jgi:hypothetical protein
MTHRVNSYYIVTLKKGHPSLKELLFLAEVLAIQEED